MLNGRSEHVCHCDLPARQAWLPHAPMRNIDKAFSMGNIVPLGMCVNKIYHE